MVQGIFSKMYPFTSSPNSRHPYAANGKFTAITIKQATSISLTTQLIKRKFNSTHYSQLAIVAISNQSRVEPIIPALYEHNRVAEALCIMSVNLSLIYSKF